MSVTLSDLSVVMVAQLQSAFEKRRSVDFKGFTECWTSVLGTRTSPEMLQLIFNMIDVSGDGQVTWDEINHHIRMLHRDELADAERFTVKELFTQPLPLHPYLPKEAHHRDVVHKIFLGPKDELITFGLDGALKVWGSPPEYPLEDTLHYTSHGGVDCAYDPGSAIAAVCCCDETISLVSIHSRKVLGNLHLDRASPAYRTEYRAPASSPPFLFRGKYAPDLKGSIMEKVWVSRHSNLLQRVWAHGKCVTEEDTLVVEGAPDCRVTAVGIKVDGSNITIYVGDERGQVSMVTGMRIGHMSDSHAKVVHEWQLHHEAITQISMMGDTIVTSSKDSNVHVTTSDRGVLLRTLRGSNFESTRCHSRGVRGFALSPGNEPAHLVTWGLEKHAVVWDPSVGKQVGSLVCSKTISAVCVDGMNRAYTFSVNRQVRVWDLSNFNCLQQLRQNPWESVGPPGALFAHPSGELIVTTHRIVRHEALSIEDAHNASRVWKPVSSTHLWSQGNLMLVSDEASVSLWSLEGGFVLSTWKYDALLSMRGDGDGTAFLCEFSTGELQAMRSSDGRVALVLAGTYKEQGFDVHYVSWKSRWVVATRNELLLFDGGSLDENIVVRQPFERRDLSKLPVCSCLAMHSDSAVLGFMSGDVVVVAGAQIGAYGTLPSLRRLPRKEATDLWWVQIPIPEAVGCEWCSVVVGPLHHSPSHTVLRAIPQFRTAGKGGAFEREFESLDSSRERISAITSMGEHLIATSDYQGTITLWSIGLGTEIFAWQAAFAPRSFVTQLEYDGCDTLYCGDDIGYLGAFRIGAPLVSVKQTIPPAILPSEHIQRVLLHRVSPFSISTLTWTGGSVCIGTSGGEVLLYKASTDVIRLDGPGPTPFDDDPALQVALDAYRWDYIANMCADRRCPTELEALALAIPHLFPDSSTFKRSVTQCIGPLLVEEGGQLVALLSKRKAQSQEPTVTPEEEAVLDIRQMWRILDSTRAAYFPSSPLQRPVDINFCQSLVDAVSVNPSAPSPDLGDADEELTQLVIGNSSPKATMEVPTETSCPSHVAPRWDGPTILWCLPVFLRIGSHPLAAPLSRVSRDAAPSPHCRLPRHEVYERHIAEVSEHNERQILLRVELSNRLLVDYESSILASLATLYQSAHHFMTMFNSHSLVLAETCTRFETVDAERAEWRTLLSESIQGRSSIRRASIQTIFQIRKSDQTGGDDPLGGPSVFKLWTHFLTGVRTSAMVASEDFSVLTGTAVRESFKARCVELVDQRGTKRLYQLNPYSWDSVEDDIRIVLVTCSTMLDICGSADEAVRLARQQYRSFNLLSAVAPFYIGTPLCCMVYRGADVFLCSSSIPTGTPTDLSRSLVADTWLGANIKSSVLSTYPTGQVVLSPTGPCGLVVDQMYIRPEALDDTILQEGSLTKFLRRTEGVLLNSLLNALSNEVLLTGNRLCAMTHSTGINIRYLGRVLLHAVRMRSPHVAVIQCEILARTLKAHLRGLWMHNANHNRITIRVLQLAKECLQEHHDQSNAALFIEDTLGPLVYTKFGVEWALLSTCPYDDLYWRLLSLCGVTVADGASCEYSALCRSTVSTARTPHDIPKLKCRRLWALAQDASSPESIYVRLVIACNRPKGVSVTGVASQLQGIVSTSIYPFTRAIVDVLVMPRATLGGITSILDTNLPASVERSVLLVGIATQLASRGYVYEATKTLRSSSMEGLPATFTSSICFSYIQLQTLLQRLGGSDTEPAIIAKSHAQCLLRSPSIELVRTCLIHIIKAYIYGRTEQSALDVLNIAAPIFFGGHFSSQLLEVGFEARFKIAREDGVSFLVSCPTSALRNVLLLEAAISSNNLSALDTLCRDAVDTSFAKLEPLLKCQYHRAVGCALSILGQGEASLTSLTKALNVSETFMGGISAASATDLMYIASAMFQHSNTSQARTTYEVASRLFKQAEGETCHQAISCERWGARCAITQSDPVKGTVVIRRIVELLTNFLATGGPYDQSLHIELAAANADLGCLLLCVTETSMSSHKDIHQQLHVGDGGKQQLDDALHHLEQALRGYEQWLPRTPITRALADIVFLCRECIDGIDDSMDSRVHKAQRERVVKTWLRGAQKSPQSSSWMQFLKIAPLM